MSYPNSDNDSPPSSIEPLLHSLIATLNQTDEPSNNSIDSTLDVASIAQRIQSHLARAREWAESLPGGDVLESEIEDVIHVLETRVQCLRSVDQRYEGSCLPLSAFALLPGSCISTFHRADRHLTTCFSHHPSLLEPFESNPEHLYQRLLNSNPPTINYLPTSPPTIVPHMPTLAKMIP